MCDNDYNMKDTCVHVDHLCVSVTESKTGDCVHTQHLCCLLISANAVHCRDKKKEAGVGSVF